MKGILLLLGLLTPPALTVYFILEERAECLANIDNFELEGPEIAEKFLEIFGVEDDAMKEAYCLDKYSINGLYRWVTYGEGGGKYFEDWE